MASVANKLNIGKKNCLQKSGINNFFSLHMNLSCNYVYCIFKLFDFLIGLTEKSRYLMIQSHLCSVVSLH